MTTKRGFRFSTSVGGVLTGRGGNMIIIDDPLKPADAMSDAARARHIEWYSTTLISRLDNKEEDAIIVVMQRLHEGDLVGHLLQERGWQHLSLPAIAETEQQIEIGAGRYHSRQIDDLLHPARESREALDRIKRGMGSATFSAQYQQAPVPPGGNMIDWAWFGWYEPNNTRTFDEIVISWDTAMKVSELSDYSVGTVWGVWCGLYYLLDLIRVPPGLSSTPTQSRGPVPPIPSGHASDRRCRVWHEPYPRPQRLEYPGCANQAGGRQEGADGCAIGQDRGWRSVPATACQVARRSTNRDARVSLRGAR